MLIPLSLPAFAVELEVELQQFQYTTDAVYEEQANRYSNVVPSLRSDSSYLGGLVTSKVTASSIIPLNEEGEFHFYVEDFYLRYAPVVTEGRGWAFTLGRSLRLWSQLDHDWGLGLWQPLFRYDYVSPQPMGLTGFFAEWISPDFKLQLFASPLHLPDQQGDFEIVNGEMKSGNRWFRAPISSVEIVNGKSNIFYELRRPEVKDVVFHGSMGGAFVAGDLNDGPWLRAGLVTKPMNQFHMAIDGEGILVHEKSGYHLRPIIYPMVVRHNLSTLEAGFSWDDRNRFYLSGTIERIQDPRVPDMWDETKLVDAAYAGFGGQMSLQRLGLKQSLFRFGYVAREDLESAGATLIEGEIEGSNQRLAFEQLAYVGLSYPVYRGRQHQWFGDLRYTYSFSDRGEWLTTRVNYAPSRNLVWHIGFDILGAPDEVDGERSFISNYRNNDRVTGGLSYVF